MSIASDIRTIQDRLAGPGMWTRGQWHRGKAACLVGAVHDVRGALTRRLSPEEMAENRLLIEFLTECAKAWGDQEIDTAYTCTLPAFNDYVLSDKRELMLFLDACLDVAEAEGL